MWQDTELGLTSSLLSAEEWRMNLMNQEIEHSFRDAFWTILIQEHRGSEMSLAQWARASEVDLHSLKLLIDEVRGIHCTYAIRLCCGLQLNFARVVREAIQLKFKTPTGKRCAWRPYLQEDRSAFDATSPQEAGNIAASLCAAFAQRITDSRRSFSELARESGVGHTVISRLGQAGRQNPSLQSLFDLSCALGCQLDVLAREVSYTLKTTHKKKEAAHA